ncbi:MAG: bile acid:sodium symporter [Thermodesulfobacteriota bacterium]
MLLGLLMLGLALELKTEDFRRVFLSPGALLVGLAAQVALLPAFTYLLTLLLRPAPSVALGLLLIGACPGPAISNVFTFLARGNVALCVALTVISTAAAVLTTPINLALWGAIQPDTSALIKKVSLDPMDVYMNIIMMMGVPLFLGMTLSRLFPPLAGALRRPFRIFIWIVILTFIGIALFMNWEVFRRLDGPVVLAVFLHNALALSLGCLSGLALKLAPGDTRAVCMQVGIQNSALGLILILKFFDGLGGMAVVAAWWGPWSAISGLGVALFMARGSLPAKHTV